MRNFMICSMALATVAGALVWDDQPHGRRAAAGTQESADTGERAGARAAAGGNAAAGQGPALARPGRRRE